MRVVIVDDEAPARSRLKELLADCARASASFRRASRIGLSR